MKQSENEVKTKQRVFTVQNASVLLFAWPFIHFKNNNELKGTVLCLIVLPVLYKIPFTVKIPSK